MFFKNFNSRTSSLKIMSNSTFKSNLIQSQKKESLTPIDAIRTYLHEIGRIPLLNHEQEIFFATQVQQMMILLAAKEELSKKLQREPREQEWAEQVNLAEEILLKQLSDGQIAKQKMIKANLR